VVVLGEILFFGGGGGWKGGGFFSEKSIQGIHLMI